MNMKPHSLHVSISLEVLLGNFPWPSLKPGPDRTRPDQTGPDRIGPDQKSDGSEQERTSIISHAHHVRSEVGVI